MLDGTLLGTRKLYTIAISSRVKNDYWYSHNNNMTYKLLKLLDLLKLLKWVLPSTILMVVNGGVSCLIISVYIILKIVCCCCVYIRGLEL